jgi:hypothetical protein
LSLYVITHYARYGVKLRFNTLTSTPDEGEWSASRPGRLIFGCLRHPFGRSYILSRWLEDKGLETCTLWSTPEFQGFSSHHITGDDTSRESSYQQTKQLCQCQQWYPQSLSDNVYQKLSLFTLLYQTIAQPAKKYLVVYRTVSSSPRSEKPATNHILRQSTPSYSRSALILSSHLRIRLLCYLFPFGFAKNISYGLFTFPAPNTRLDFLYLISLVTYD